MSNIVFDKIYKCLEENSNVELVEIIETTGSTPRSKGAMMAIDLKGNAVGTVGGGLTEYLAINKAKELLEKKQDGEEIYNMSPEGAASLGLVCGGKAVVKFTYLSNDEKSREYLKCLIEKLNKKSIIYIFGAGHVSKELNHVLNYLGFDTVIWDDREEFANKARFLEAKKVICKSYKDIIKEINITSDDFVVVMTRGHISDYEVLKQVLKYDAYYIGCIGSRQKNKHLYGLLLNDGFDKEKLDTIHAPIGISIGAEAPEEIAVSIAAEIILYNSLKEKRRKVLEGKTILGKVLV